MLKRIDEAKGSLNNITAVDLTLSTHKYMLTKLIGYYTAAKDIHH